MPPGKGRFPASLRYARLPNAPFQFMRGRHAAPILMRDDRRQRLPVFVHRDPRRRHDRQRDDIRLVRRGSQVADRSADGRQEFCRINLDMDALVFCWKPRMHDAPDNLSVAQQAGLDRGRADVQTEICHDLQVLPSSAFACNASLRESQRIAIRWL